MTIKLPSELERDIRAEVLSGHFASVDDAMAEAVRLLLLHRGQGQAGANRSSDERTLTEDERADQEAQHRLFAAGLLSEIKPPIRDLAPYQHRQAIPIKGEPLSETVIRDRR